MRGKKKENKKEGEKEREREEEEEEEEEVGEKITERLRRGKKLNSEHPDTDGKGMGEKRFTLSGASSVSDFLLERAKRFSPIPFPSLSGLF